MPKYFSPDIALQKLKLFFSLEYDLLRHAIGYCPLIPVYVDKCQVMRHFYEDLKRVRSIRERVQDFGILYPEKHLQETWTNVVRHLMTAKNMNHFVGALYRVIKTELSVAYRQYIQNTLRLNDAPSVEAFEDHLPTLERQIAWGKQFMEAGNIGYVEEREIIQFEAEVRDHIRKLGGIYQESKGEGLADIPSYPEFQMPNEMELEERFIWRSAERVYDTFGGEEHPAHHSYVHFTELPVIDICASFVYDGREMPFDYITDFVRQTWDEVRHSQMGFSRLRSMGIDPYSLAIPIGHYKAYMTVPVMERIAALTQVGEACSFAPKKKWVQQAKQDGDILTALEHDFDMVDEKNHVKFGSKWLRDMIQKKKDNRDFKSIVSEAEYSIREVINELKKEKGEKWLADLGPRFDSCQDSDSPLNLAPNIIIA